MATSPPTNVKPTAPAGGSGWVLEAKGNDPGSLNISRDISTGANQSITVRPGTQFRMKPSGKSKVDKNAETAQTAKWGDDLLVTVPGGGQVLLKGFYYKSPNAPPSKMVIEQKNGMLRKVEGRPGAEPSDSPNPAAQENKDGDTYAGALIGGKGSSSSSSSAGGGSGGGKPYQEGGYKQSSEKVAKKGNKKSDEEDDENSGGFFSWLASGGVNSLGALGLLGLSGAKKDSGTTVNVSVPSTSSGSSSTIPAVSSLRISDDTGASSSDLITKTASQTVSGTLSTSLLSGQTVKVSTDNGSTWTAATATTGSTTFSLSGATLSGSSTLMAKAVNTSLAEGTSLSKAYVLDTTAPTATLTTGTYANTASATVQSSETGAAYLVNNTIIVTNEASITSASGTSWNSVAISAANTNTLLSLTGLVDGSYKLYTVDAAGNLSTASTNTFTVNAAATGLTTSVTRLQLSADTGISPTDRITKTASQTVSGDLSAALAAYESVYITADGGSNWYAATASTGSTSFSLSGFSLEVGTNNSMQAKVMNTFTSSSSAIYSILYTLDTTAPTVSSVAFSGATGAQNNFLNAGDVVSATVTFSEAVTVTTTNGTPYLNLNVGGTTVQAAYASGSGTTALIFSYTILSGQTDANGVSIDTNSLNLNNGSITDTAGNTATLTHTAVSDNASYMVDTTAPTTTVSTVVFSADTGTSGSDFVTATAAQDISGTLSANLVSGETVYVSLNNGSTWTAATATVGQNTYSLTGQTLTSSNTLKVKLTDAAGNSGTVLSQAYVLDAAVPTVSSVAITSATGAQNNYLNAGDVVTATATFSEAVTIGGAPYLNLNINGTTVQAAYASGSGTSALTFSYTILAGQTDANGISIAVNSLNLNSGTITDAAGNNATITHTAVTDNASYMVDNIAPTATLNTATLTNTSNATVQSSEVGTAYLVNSTISVANEASITSASGTSWNSVAISAASANTSLALTGLVDGTYKLYTVDAAGNLSAVSSNSVMVDSTSSTVSSVAITSATGATNNTLNAGDIVTATATFSEAVTVDTTSGIPYMNLNVGGTTVQAAYAGGSGTTALLFSYTILSGQTDTNGISIAANSMNLNSGTIKDTAGNSATITHTAVTDNASYMVDTTAPTVSSVAITGATGAVSNYVNTGDVVTATVTFSEAVTVVTTGGTPYLNLNIGGTTVQAAYASGTGTTALTFTYTILSGQTDANGISIDANSLNLNSGTITDSAGNSATLTHTAVADNASYMVDTTAPTASVTTATLANTSSATVQSSETGTAYLVKNTVSVTNEASITGASDTSWNSVAISAANTNTGLALTGLVDGSYKLYTVDAAGNLSSASSNTVTVNSNSQAGNAVIDLGSYGKLIAPVQVEGNWYYHWDRSGDGTSANTGSLNGGLDYVIHDVLDGIFQYDINDTLNPNAGTNTTDTYRYATLNGVKVALPTYGAGLDGSGNASPINIQKASTSASNNPTTDNPTYNDLLAIWDSQNGSTVGDSNVNGKPAGWQAGGYYWSATPSAFGHAGVFLNNGNVNDSLDTEISYVALQVLPIVIDLNHDGALSYGKVVMDVNGDGLLDATRWAGAQDGVLVWDKYHDGQVHDHTQYAFAQYDTTSSAQGKTATDLSGLTDAFDSNHDGVFDARDAQFADFSVWQDANQNGVSDAGEVKSLAELGLASLNLSSDGVARNPVDGVQEAGQTSALTAEGKQVLVADVGFDFSTLVLLDLRADPEANTLSLNLSDLLASPNQTLVVQGDINDSVKLEGEGWVNSGAVATLGDHNFVVWNNSTAQVLIDQDMVNHGRVL